MKMLFVKTAALFAAGTAIVCSAHPADAHGRAGQRLFPATLVVEDPAVANELTLPQVGSFRENEDGEVGRINEYEGEFSRKLTDRLGVSVEGAYVDEPGGTHGFDNWGIAAKFQALENDEHETLISLGLDWDVGNSGAERIGEDFSTLTPQLFFGKGFGDLPDNMELLKPFALTGVAGVAMPLEHEESNTLTYGFTLQYSLPYLQQHVRDVGLGAPFNNMVPLVEFTFETPIDHADDYHTTGTINPGVIWTGEKMQYGLEAIVPLNSESGSGVGVRAQVHFYLDDLAPSLFSKPVFGK